jgi:2-phosphoglycerate kinase
VRPAVEEYYSKLTDETIYWFLRVHHENIWPTVEQKIKSELDLGRRFVLEGSALRPEMISTLDCRDLLIVGLYADPDFLRARMEAESRYAEQSEHRKTLISRFVTRSLRDNDQVIEEARRLELRLIDVADAVNFQAAVEELTAV